MKIKKWFKELLRDILELDQIEQDVWENITELSEITYQHDKDVLHTETSLGEHATALRILFDSDRTFIEQSLEDDQWVTPKFFLNAHCMSEDYSDFSMKVYDLWKVTHKNSDPTLCRYDKTTFIYPVGYMTTVLNGGYDHLL